ncbi:MAG TPA: hypothetical protein VF381_02195 [Thermoanaerobaculia bacterium]
MSESAVVYRDDDPIEEPVSVSRFVNVYRGYSKTIYLSLCAVAILYGIVALVIYFTAPSVRVISQPFSLDFKHAEDGKYPNGEAFSVNEIVAEPILSGVYKETHMNEYMSFRDFVGSVYISEANPEYEKLLRQYQPRLSDPKLTNAERQQVEKDFEEKKASLKKNLYSLNFTNPRGVKEIPQEIVKRALSTILARWADWAQAEGRVTSYDATILSPSVLDDTPRTNQIIAIRILIKRLAQVLHNIDELALLPSADVARTPTDHLSLAELRIKIEDLIRFRLEPEVATARAMSAPADPETLRFAQTQLEYDQRQLQSYQDRVSAVRDALALYTSQRTVSFDGPSQTRTTNQAGTSPQRQETVMPQVSDTFIDRMAQLLNQSADVQYRQRMVTELRRIQNDMTPIQEAVRYDQQMVRELGTPLPAATTSKNVAADVEDVRNDAKLLVGKVNDIYQVMSRNLNPETYLFTKTSAPTTYVMRDLSLSMLALIGVLVMLVAVPVIFIFCLLHNRVREEEQEGKDEKAAANPTVAAVRS